MGVTIAMLRLLSLLVLAGTIATFAAGCARPEPCFGVLGATPTSVLLLNRCTGEISAKPFAPTPATPPTSTTIPFGRFGV